MITISTQISAIITYLHPKRIQDADDSEITHFSRYNFDENKANCIEGLLVSIIQATEWSKFYGNIMQTKYPSILSGLVKGSALDESKENTHCRVQILREIRNNEYKALHSIPDVPKDRIIPWQP